MKKLILLLCIATSFTLLADNPKTEKGKKPKENYVISPQPINPGGVNNKPLECCRIVNYGYSWIDGCLSWGYECCCACGNHGWLITSCKDGVKVIGAFISAGSNGNNNGSPVQMRLPLEISYVVKEGAITTEDPITQITEINQIKNKVITFEKEFEFEFEGDTYTFKKGDYQISNSELLIVAKRSH